MSSPLLNSTINRLIAHALKARNMAYAPYSHYNVGAALLTPGGKIVTGCNVENASYGLTICAERGAIMAAVAQGHRAFRAIAVATENGGSPCGACRQVLAEFGVDMIVIICDVTGKHLVTTVRELLPGSFDASKL